MVRPNLKARGRTLVDVTADLDAIQADGFDAVEVFAPCAGGDCYSGLDTLDFFAIDPAIGTMADFQRLVVEAHRRGMAVVAFLNLGYSHERFPAFLRACDDVRAGRETPDTRMFVWSQDGTTVMDRPLAPWFFNDAYGNWRWSDRAQSYFWVKWEGEHGGHHLPQFNWADPGWQTEARRIVEFWAATGIDGMVLDAVNWYIGADWEIARRAMTEPLAAGMFSQPEGAGGFGDDPVPWIRDGGFTCIMDYSIKLWWEEKDLVRDAITAGDPSPIEDALRGYRDRVVGAGAVCYIDASPMPDAPLAPRLLAAATVATVGELYLAIGDQAGTDESYRAGVRELLAARRRYPALGAGGRRTRLEASDDGVYAVLREPTGDGEAVLVLLNFRPEPRAAAIDLGHRAGEAVDIRTGERRAFVGAVRVELPPHGYAMLALAD
jgi:glycosidase